MTSVLGKGNGGIPGQVHGSSRGRSPPITTVIKPRERSVRELPIHRDMAIHAANERLDESVEALVRVLA
jgi:hypothetical protein